MSRKVWVFAFVCVLVSGSALASGIEVAPTIGYRFDGDFDHLSLEGTSGSLSLDDTEEYGLILSFPVTKRVDLEFRWTHQSADLEPTMHTETPEQLQSDSYLVGTLIYFPVKSKTIKPYMNIELGATHFDPDNGFTGQSAFAYAVGGGSKFLFGKRFGVRLQGSYLSSNIPGGRDVFCKEDICYTGTSRNSVSQFELTGGFIFRF